MKLKSFVVFSASVAAASLAHAGVVWQAVGVTTPDGNDNGFFPASRLINRSGLNTAYVSGVTDFDTYAATTTASNSGSSTGGGRGNRATFLFDLGSIVSLAGAALWNQADGSTSSIKSYDFYGSVDGIAYSLFGDGSTTNTGGNAAAPSSVSTWLAQDARYVQLRTTDNFGFAGATRFNEIVFDVDVPNASVPEPQSLALVVAALGAAGFATRRKRAGAQSGAAAA